MSWRTQYYGLPASMALWLSACATVPAPEVGPPLSKPSVRAPVVSPFEPLVAPHREKAEALEREGHLRGALNEWKVALTIHPGDPVALAEKTKLERRIEQVIADRLKQGRDALGRGNHPEARRHFLAVLAVDPANDAAFQALRSETREVRFVNHKVRKGETLASIAEFYYGERSRSEVIWETNQLPPNPRLAAGSVLKIPEIPGVPFLRPDVSRETRARETPPPVSKAEDGKEEQIYANPTLVEAKEALERGEFAIALADVDRFLATDPRNAEGVDLKKAVLYQQGRLFLKEKNYAQSYRALSQLAKLAPNYQDAGSLMGQARTRLIQDHYNQGIRLYRDEKLEAAIEQWRMVLEYDPAHGAAQRNIQQAERLLKGLQQRQKRK
ncbi:MAG: LysM peptidoglycan-binding domain-containing protein [Deltaproteobacteria bacterium]|nr:LysM peptidoglycan-binding domain-containing protein [Deltaproteobacteria bacterium]